MAVITIPKKITGREELVIMPRKEYEILRGAFKILKERKRVTEEDILRWSREADALKKTGQLPILYSLRDLR